MKTKGSWVIKTSNGNYWCGNNLFNEQIRKAQIYHWKENAEEQAAYIWKRNKISEDVTWEVIAVVEPKELKDTETYWELSSFLPGEYFCHGCGEFALHKSNSTEVLSKFCPHCGKYMTNHTQED